MQINHPAGTWKLDSTRSKLQWTLPQLVGKTRGTFAEFDATIVSAPALLDSSVTALISLASIDTGNAKRDEHLRGPKYFDVERNPTASYRSHGVRRSADGAVVDGSLTLFGVTASVPLDVHSWQLATDAGGRRTATLAASAELSRRTFGVTIPMDGGGRIFSDRLVLAIDVHAVLV